MLIRYFDTNLRFWQALPLVEDLTAKRSAEVVQASKAAELELVIIVQA
jgi:hypothetical protein